MFKEQRGGSLRIYEKPLDQKGYSIGADVSEGLAIGDLSTACVLDSNKKQVAQYGGKIHPKDFGKMLCRLGKYYNTAILVPEVNNIGISTIDAIVELGYNQIYTREVEEIRGEELQKKIGWQTNKKTKMKALNEFVANYRDKEVLLYDDRLLKEMAKVRVEDDGKVILNGKDYVVSVMLAIQGLEQLVIKGQFKASVPGQINKPMENKITSMTIEEKLRYYKNKKRSVSSFE